jgi:hypothetical protein
VRSWETLTVKSSMPAARSSSWSNGVRSWEPVRCSAMAPMSTRSPKWPWRPRRAGGASATS